MRVVCSIRLSVDSASPRPERDRFLDSPGCEHLRCLLPGVGYLWPRRGHFGLKAFQDENTKDIRANLKIRKLENLLVQSLCDWSRHSAICGLGLAEAGKRQIILTPHAASISDASCQGLAIFGLAEAISVSKLVRMKTTNDSLTTLRVSKIEDFLVQSRRDCWEEEVVCICNPRHKMQAF